MIQSKEQPLTLGEVARLLKGEVVGDPEIRIVSAASIHKARPADITFVEKEKGLAELSKSRAGAAIVPLAVESAAIPVVRVANPLDAFVQIFRLLHGITEEPRIGIHPRAVIDDTAEVGPDADIHACAHVGAGTVIGARCHLGPGVVIGRDCRLGDDVTIHANAVLYRRTIVGNLVTIHAGAVIGADGFGYRQVDGKHVHVPQLGYVEIGDSVEIGAGATIDRSTFDVTRIGAGTKIDNLVQIGHNCEIGQHNILVSQCGIAGSCVTGDYVVIAGQAGIKDHTTIGAGALIGAQAGVLKDVLPKERLLGSPAIPWKEKMFSNWLIEHLPEWRKDLQRIKEELGIK